MNKRRIVCAAIRDGAGQIIAGPRHYDEIMHAAVNNLLGYTLPWEQGFIDQYGVFLSREEAWKVAEQAGQILYRCGGDGAELFSENLY